MTPRMHRFIQHSLTSKIFLGLLASAYLVYLGAFVHVLPAFFSASSDVVVDHPQQSNPAVAVQYWTAANMRGAINADLLAGPAPKLTQANSAISAGKAAQQQGQPPLKGDAAYPLSTVGKVFFTNAAGQNLVCSGTAVASLNRSVVDTAGHCLYWQGNWGQNVIFCPLYDTGKTPYGCWAARDLEVPSDWIDASLNDLHHDFGMIVVAPNSAGNLTGVVGGAGWAYNQPVNQPFTAYGYPAAPPYDGQTRQTCSSSSGTLWQHGSGTVVSIPCPLTGGSSGGPWFIKIGDSLYLNGHNDFTSSLQLGHMFSPYYDDTWYALYNKAQQD